MALHLAYGIHLPVCPTREIQFIFQLDLFFPWTYSFCNFPVEWCNDDTILKPRVTISQTHLFRALPGEHSQPSQGLNAI